MTRKPRQNPLTKLAAQAFADQDRLLLKEMRKAEERYGFEAAALALSEWTGRGHEEMRAHGLRAISDYVRTEFKGAGDALEWLVSENRRLGVWCTCAVAREALEYVPKRNDRPRIAIETTEDWVRGKVTKRKIINADNDVTAVINYDDEIFFDTSSAASYAAWTAWTSDPISAVVASRKTAYLSAKTEAAVSGGYLSSDDVQSRLVDVVADAIMTFPQKRAKRRT